MTRILVHNKNALTISESEHPVIEEKVIGYLAA